MTEELCQLSEIGRHAQAHAAALPCDHPQGILPERARAYLEHISWCQPCAELYCFKRQAFYPKLYPSCSTPPAYPS